MSTLIIIVYNKVPFAIHFTRKATYRIGERFINGTLFVGRVFRCVCKIECLENWK